MLKGKVLIYLAFNAIIEYKNEKVKFLIEVKFY